MPLATLTSKGQLTLPKSVRQGLGVSSGDPISFIEVAPGRYEIVAATHDVSDLKGPFGSAKRTATLEEMEEAISRMGRA